MPPPGASHPFQCLVPFALPQLTTCEGSTEGRLLHDKGRLGIVRTKMPIEADQFRDSKSQAAMYVHGLNALAALCRSAPSVLGPSGTPAKGIA